MERFVACISTILVVIISRESVTAGTNNAWEFTCNITNGNTGVSWTILQPSYISQVLSTCNILSQWCSRIEGCNAIATISGSTSFLNISSSFLNTGQVTCTETKENADNQTHSNLTRHPINWTCDPNPVSESTRGLSSTLQSTSTVFTTTSVGDTSTTTNKVYPATSKVSTTISEATTTTSKAALTTWTKPTTLIETSTTVIGTSTIMDTVFPSTSETSTTNDELSTTTSKASTTSNKSTTGTRETPATTIETSTTSSTASTSTTIEASTTNEILSMPIESPTTKGYTVSDASTQITSPQNSIYSRDSGGGATAGAIAGTVVGIILICVIVAFVFVIYKRRQKRNTCPPSDQTFPDETGVADCVNPVYQPSEAISPSPAVQTPGSSSDLSQGRATETVLSDEVGQYAGLSMTPSTATSNHEIRSKPLKPERKFLSKSAYIPGSPPETGGDVYAVVDKTRKSNLITDNKELFSTEKVADGLYAVVDKTRKSNLITDNKEPLSTEKVADGLYAVVDKTRKSNLITDNKEPLSTEKVTDGLYAVPDKLSKPPTGTDQARSLIDENSKHDVPSESLNYSLISDIPYNKTNPDRGNKMLSEEVYTEVKKPIKPIKVKPELKPKPDQKVELYAEVKKRHERSDNNSGSSQNRDAHLESNKRKTIW